MRKLYIRNYKTAAFRPQRDNRYSGIPPGKPPALGRMASILSVIILLTFILTDDRVQSQELYRYNVLLLSVDDVRMLAINNNLDIKLAQLDSRIKGTELGYKEAVFDTILNATVSYTDNQLKPASSIPGTKNVTNNYSIGIDKKLKSGTDVSIDFTNTREWTNSQFISLNPYHNSQIEINLAQPIARNFFGLIDRGNIEIIKYEIKNAKLDAYTRIENAIISAEKSYWKLVFAREAFYLKKEMLKKAIILFNQYRRKLRMGLVETGDVLAAEANMHIRESDLLMSSNEVKSAEEFLKLKLDLGNKIMILPADDNLKTEFNTNFTESLKIAFNNRRDYKSNKNNIENKKIKLKMKMNSRLPEIDLKATFAANGLDARYYEALKGITRDYSPKYFIGIQFTYPLENNKATSEYKKSVLEKTRAIINLQKTERQIISDIDEKFRRLSIDRLNITKMERIENLQRGKLFQEEQRFKYGRSNSDILIRYQEDLLKAELMTKKAYFDYRMSILDLLDAEDSYMRYIGLE